MTSSSPVNQPVWADAPAPSFAPLRGEHDADVCVIGLGGSGLTAIETLLGLGARVIGIDAGTVAGAAAGRNGGFLLAGGAEFHHDAVRRWGRERAVQIYHQTLEELDRFLADPATRARRTGSLRLATSPEEVVDCREQFDAMRRDSLPVEWYRGSEGEGLLVPTDAAFQPRARCIAMAERIAARGVPLHENTPALGLGQGWVETSEGMITAPLVIVAVDGNLERLLPELAGQVRTARLQMLATAPTDEVRIPMPVYARYGFEYWQQLPDGRVALGGLRDRFGEVEWNGDATPSEALQQELERVLREQVGVRHAAITHRWAGATGFTPDYLPVVRMVRPGVVAVGGYCGTGNLVGALCARAVATWAMTGNLSSLGGFADNTSHFG